MKKTLITMSAAALMLAFSAQAATNEPVVPTTTLTAKVAVSTLCKAIMSGDVDMVKKLIELGEDVNEKSLGMTPAIFAARYNKAEILKVLIANGADLKVKCNKGFSITKYAEMSHATEAMAVIKEAMKK